jgi:hypothetical protein
MAATIWSIAIVSEDISRGNQEINIVKKRMNGICVTFSILTLSLVGSCSPASTSTPVASTPPEQTSAAIADVEKLAGFDVREPAYLPKGVSFDTAAYQTAPNPLVVLQFTLKHETYGDMGNFFQITQEVQNEAPSDVLSCGENAEGCEVLQINGIPVFYHQNPAGPEALDWYANGFVFRLLRTAGEPNKIYKDELVKVVESMK